MAELMYMPTQMRDAVAVRLDKLRKDIAESISSNGLMASGKTAASMYVVVTETEVSLYGRAFFAALETGSSRWTGATGVSCSFVEFQDIIRNWASAKGLNFGQSRDWDKAVAAIAMKIIKQGTLQHSRTRLDVYTSLVEEAMTDCENLCMDIANAQVNNVIAQWS